MSGNLLGNFHPALVHFPVAFLTVGAAFEGWAAVRGAPRSATGRTLLLVGVLGAAAAVVSGLLHFDPEGYRGRTLEAARIHRVLGLATLGLSVLAVLIGEIPRARPLAGTRLRIYRLVYFTTAVFAGLAGHYGGWIVFGWGSIWTF